MFFWIFLILFLVSIVGWAWLEIAYWLMSKFEKYGDNVATFAFIMYACSTISLLLTIT